jgi:hypothetical protein
VLELRALGGRLDRLRLRARQLGLCEQHVGSRHDAAFETDLRQVVRALVSLHGALEQRLLNLGRAHQEVGLRQGGLSGQPCRGEVVGARLIRGLRLALRLRQLAPQVDFPARDDARGDAVRRVLRVLCAGRRRLRASAARGDTAVDSVGHSAARLATYVARALATCASATFRFSLPMTRRRSRSSSTGSPNIVHHSSGTAGDVGRRACCHSPASL